MSLVMLQLKLIGGFNGCGYIAIVNHYQDYDTIICNT